MVVEIAPSQALLQLSLVKVSLMVRLGALLQLGFMLPIQAALAVLLGAPGVWLVATAALVQLALRFQLLEVLFVNENTFADAVPAK